MLSVLKKLSRMKTHLLNLSDTTCVQSSKKVLLPLSVKGAWKKSVETDIKGTSVDTTYYICLKI